jgi:hypothetical protein
MSNEVKHGLTLEITTAAGDVVVIATLRLTPPQAIQLAELLKDYAFDAQAPGPKTTPEGANYNALLAAAWPPGKPGAHGTPTRRRTKKTHARP